MGSQDESSLAARRARLRGSLAKQALPSDPYSQDPYARAKTPEPDKPENAGTGTVSSSAPASKGQEPKASNGLAGANATNGANGGNGGNGQSQTPPPRPNFRLEDLAATQQLKPAVATPGSEFANLAQSPPVSPIAATSSPTPAAAPVKSTLSSHMPTGGGAAFGLGSLSESLKNLSRNPNGSSTSGASALTEIADWSTAESEPETTADPQPEPQLQPQSEAVLEPDFFPTIEANSSDLSAEVAYEEEFVSLDSVAASVGNFFEQPVQTSEPEPGKNAGKNATFDELTEAEISAAPWAHLPTGDQDFFDNKNSKQQAALEPAANAAIEESQISDSPILQSPLAKSQTAEAPSSEPAIAESPVEEPQIEPAAPIISRETKGKKVNPKTQKNQQPEEPAQEEDLTPAAPISQAGQSESKAKNNQPAPAAVSDVVGNNLITHPAAGPAHVIIDEVTHPTKVIVDQPAHVIIDKIAHVQVLDTLSNMDQAMGACAMNLSALQATANQQTEALRNLSEILQNQTFSELGMSLSGLMESLSAALEPMKAVSELVPAIDQLVQVMETKIKGEPEPEEKLSPDQLVMNLADQLSTGAIDPWTFKSAYMAIFPDDHPADLLHRLVDLLGTSRLSGNLFRAAYDAVQAPDPPKRVATEDGNTIVKVVQDETLMQQLEELRKNQNDFEKKMGAREEEFAELLQSKDQELLDAQELLNSRWEEFNQRYDELSESLQKRDALIQEKESEISRKDNENGRLRTQMDELKDMVGELQKQFSASKARAEALSKPGFFDSAPAAGPAPSLFDAAPARPLFQGDQQVQQQQPPQPQVQQQSQPVAQAQAPAAMAPQQQQQHVANMGPPPQPAMSGAQQDMNMGGAPPQMTPQAPSQQAIPRQNQMTTPFANAGPGSYGSGVRAQVFEVIVRQALAGAPWREICAGPMQVNNISPDEVESEVKRRQALLKK